MRVLIADQFEKWGIERLSALGFEVHFEPSLNGDDLQRAIQTSKCEVLIVRSTKVTEPILSSSNTLGLVVRAGAGVNTIDVAAASKRSILVANCPGKNAIAVAELTFALILALDRRIVDNTVDLRNHKWNKKEYSKSRGLKGRSLGVIGLGEIGRAVVRLGQAFEMNVIAWSRSLTEEMADELAVGRYASVAEVAADCDILTIHLAAADSTRKIIDAQVLSRLKPGSYVINTARSEVLDYEALTAAVREKNLRVGIDVFPSEPSQGTGEFQTPIMDTAGVIYGSHHIGASTDQAQDAIAAETVRIVEEYMHTGRVLNCVNLAAKSRARFVLVVRHHNRPGVLAHTLNEISHAGVNVEEMENIICEGGDAACANIKLAAPLPTSVMDRIAQGNPNVLGVTSHRLPEGSD